jgi:hypothetical protein
MLKAYLFSGKGKDEYNTFILCDNCAKKHKKRNELLYINEITLNNSIKCDKCKKIISNKKNSWILNLLKVS